MTFERDGYIIVRGVLNTSKLYKYTKDRALDPYIPDTQIPNTPSFYNDAEMVKLQTKLLPIMEKNTGLKLFKTYTYFRVYKKGDVLRIHTDRPSCEISVTLHIGGDKSWDIYVMDKDENPVKVKLAPGDMLIYRGCDRAHWRPKFKGNIYSQVFLHYVDQNGPCARFKDDKR